MSAAHPYIPSHVTDVLGKTLPVTHTWPDGSWECPHCCTAYSPKQGPCRGRAIGYHTDCHAVRHAPDASYEQQLRDIGAHEALPPSALGVHCQNPACFANPHYPVEDARTRLAEHARRKAEDAARQRNHESAMKRIAEGKIARDARLAEIRAEAIGRGCCIRCALKDAPYRVKYVKHRMKCPLEK